MTQQETKHHSLFFRWFITLIISCAGGMLFYFAHFPLPWLLGPVAFLLIGSRYSKVELYWPSWLQDAGLVIVGYMMGTSFTHQMLLQILHQLPSMLLVTLITILLSGLFALLVSKLTGIPFQTTLTGSIPGGLVQMIVLGQEIKGINVTIVTFMQVVRIISVIFIIPFLVLSPIFPRGHANVGTEAAHHAVSFLHTPNTFLFLAASVALALFAKKIKFPTPFLIGPILGTAIFVANGIEAPELNSVVIDLSQLLLGAKIGLMIKPSQLDNKLKIAGVAVATGIALILFSMTTGLLLKILYPLPYVTTFLSTAPGGVAQMGIVAKEVHANLSIITGYQMFRVFFILFVMPPVIKWFFSRIKTL